MTLRVCLVEDDDDIREVLRLLFEEVGAIIEEIAKPFDVEIVFQQVERAWQRLCGTDAHP